MRTLLVRGWRFLPHSYAVVNHFQLAELSRREVRLFHLDAPFANPEWVAAESLLDAERDAVVRAVPALPSDLDPREIDAWLNMSVPYPLAASPARRTFTFGTSEWGMVAPGAVGLAAGARASLGDAPVEFITPSQWSRAGFLRSGARPARVHVVPHGADTSALRPGDREAERARRGWDATIVFLNIGAMSVNKGIDVLLRAFAAVVAEHPGALLVLKGSDALYSSRGMFENRLALLAPAEAAKVLPRTVYVGESLSLAELASLYVAADAYVCPYRAEGFNLPALEAIACGVPVLCTAGGPTDDFTKPDFARRIKSTLRPCKPPDFGMELAPNLDSLIAQMRSVIADREFRARAREAGPAFVEASFTWRHAVDRLLKVLFAE